MLSILSQFLLIAQLKSGPEHLPANSLLLLVVTTEISFSFFFFFFFFVSPAMTQGLAQWQRLMPLLLPSPRLLPSPLWLLQRTVRTSVPQWREIVRQQCDEVPYVDLSGRKITSKARGQTFSALLPCYMQVMLKVTSKDAAKRHKRYWSLAIKNPKA